MEKDARQQEQLNQESLPVQDERESFTLEDILREFGSGSAEEAPKATENRQVTQAQPPLEKAAARMQPEQPEQTEQPEVREEPAQPPKQTMLPEEPPAVLQAPEKRESEGMPRLITLQVPVRAQEAEAEKQEKPRKKKEPQETRKAEPHRQEGKKARRQTPDDAEATDGGPAEKKPKKHEAEPPRILSPEEAKRNYLSALGSSRLRLAICAVAALAAVFLAIYADRGWTFLQFLNGEGVSGGISVGLWALCLLLSYDVIALGLRRLFTLKPTLETLLSAAAAMTTIDAVLALRQGRMPYCAAGCLELTFGLWGLSDANLGKLRTVRVAQNSAGEPKAVTEVPSVWEGQNGLFRGEGNTERFMEQFEKPDFTAAVMRIYAPVMLVLTLGGALFLSARAGQDFIWAWEVLLLGAIPLCGFLSYTRPFAILSRRLEKSGGALCGWYGARIFRGRHTIFLSDADIFPASGISLNGMKLCGGHPMTQAVAYAAALTQVCGSPLAPLFESIRAAQNCRHCDVLAYRYYSAGVGAEIMGNVVLMGPLQFMTRMGVHMDAGMKLKQAVYLSVDGELACVFAIKYTPSAAVGDGLEALLQNGHFDVVLASRDFLVSPEMIGAKYEISTQRLRYPDLQTRLRLSGQESSRDGEQGAILQKDSFGAFADTVAGGRVLRSCVQIGTIVALAAGVTGYVLMLLLGYLGAVETASAMNLSWFLMAWALPGLLVSRWTKHR